MNAASALSCLRAARVRVARPWSVAVPALLPPVEPSPSDLPTSLLLRRTPAAHTMDLGSSSDSAPDCWDQVDMEAPGSAPSGDEIAPAATAAAEAAEAEAQRRHLSLAFSSQLNINAKPFVPSVSAAEFVPSFLPGSAQLPAPTASSCDETCIGGAAGEPQGKRMEWGAPVEPSEEGPLVSWEGSSSAVTMELSEPVVENGEVEMALEESWELKEVSEAAPKGSLGDAGPPEESGKEVMEEKEEIRKSKSVVPPTRVPHSILPPPCLQRSVPLPPGLSLPWSLKSFQD